MRDYWYNIMSKLGLDTFNIYNAQAVYELCGVIVCIDFLNNTIKTLDSYDFTCPYGL